MKKVVILILSLSSAICMAQSGKSILFLGNSYTYVNNLPQLIHDLAITTNDTLVFDSYTPGGYTLQGHSTDPSALLKIAQQSWDYVVLQEQSQLPSFSPAQVAIDVFPYARKLDSLIHANDSCTQTMFYMTWGRKYGDASNCPFYPPVCTYMGMQQRLRESYLQMADSNMAWVSPVGAAFCNSILADSLVELYQGDFSHPSLNGSYLAACVFYARIFKKNPVGNSFTAGLPNTTAAFLQNIAKITVLDSIALWNEGKFEPNADFLNNITDSLVTFSDQTTGSGSPMYYYWEFGDGHFSFAANPSHVYATSGTFTVKEYVTWRCFTDSSIQPVTLSFGSGIPEPDPASISIFPVPAHDQITIDPGNNQIIRISVTDVLGKVISNQLEKHGTKFTIDFSTVNNGVYFLKIETRLWNLVRKVIRE